MALTMVKCSFLPLARRVGAAMAGHSDSCDYCRQAVPLKNSPPAVLKSHYLKKLSDFNISFLLRKTTLTKEDQGISIKLFMICTYISNPCLGFWTP